VLYCATSCVDPPVQSSSYNEEGGWGGRSHTGWWEHVNGYAIYMHLPMGGTNNRGFCNRFLQQNRDRER
jgi:hypothetical protein